MVANLFLLSFAAVHPIGRALWYGVQEPAPNERLAGVLLVIPGRLAVPCCPSPAAADALGRLLLTTYRPSMIVGPREDTDRIWSIWGPRAEVIRRYDQRLYVLRATVDPFPPGFRKAIDRDVPQLADHAAAMEIEDLGVDPRAESPSAHLKTVQDRVRSGRTWVIEREGAILFQVHVGTASARGCQIGGTYVPPAHRGLGLGAAGVAATCARLLRSYPLVTLHVNEANQPAVRAYERCGFERSTAMRLITVRGTP